MSDKETDQLNWFEGALRFWGSGYDSSGPARVPQIFASGREMRMSGWEPRFESHHGRFEQRHRLGRPSHVGEQLPEIVARQGHVWACGAQQLFFDGQCPAVVVLGFF